MSRPPCTRLATVSSAFIQDATPEDLEDWREYTDPDAVLITGRTSRQLAAAKLDQVWSQSLPIIPVGSNHSRSVSHLNETPVYIVSTLGGLRDLSADDLTVDSPTFIVSNLLELDTNTIALTTSLRGISPVRDALPSTVHDHELVHISTELPVEYRQTVEGMRIVGANTKDRGDPSLGAIDLYANGQVLTRQFPRDAIGLRALNQVGPERAKTLQTAGYITRSAVANAQPRELLDIDGFGRDVADRIHTSAKAIVNGNVLRRADTPLPTDDPVFIDIETDGLAPTITWLIGVLNGPGATGEFTAFLQRDPADPGGALSEFMRWYRNNGRNRPLVAYNGWDFDFRVIRDHLAEFCPESVDDWHEIQLFDPYRWAVHDGNAALPGRTNRLNDVAAAVGFEGNTQGLTGAAVARTYQRWMADPGAATEPDWDRFRAYCEADVRALAVVYDQLLETDRMASNAGDRMAPSATTQRNLSEW